MGQQPRFVLLRQGQGQGQGLIALALLWLGVPQPTEAAAALSPALLARLERRAQTSRALATRFACVENVRTTVRDARGEVRRESERDYDYLLIPTSVPARPYEENRLTDGGKPVRLQQAAPAVPVAYAWLQLFSPENQAQFSYRERGTLRDGFDEVVEIEFRGLLPFVDGRDIRQWEGVAWVDAATGGIVRIQAAPRDQDEIVAAKRRWRHRRLRIAIALGGVVGKTFRVAAPVRGVSCTLRFDERHGDLGLPSAAVCEISGSRPTTVAARYSRYREFRTDGTEIVHRFPATTRR